VPLGIAREAILEAAMSRWTVLSITDGKQSIRWRRYPPSDSMCDEAISEYLGTPLGTCTDSNPSPSVVSVSPSVGAVVSEEAPAVVTPPKGDTAVEGEMDTPDGWGKASAMRQGVTPTVTGRDRERERETGTVRQTVPCVATHTFDASPFVAPHSTHSAHSAHPSRAHTPLVDGDAHSVLSQ
ncbi:hypothetical protein KIPB_012597, partial [Kipferlia bialata]